MLTRDQIVEQARSWIDTPYAHQQRIKGKKCDCIGLIVGVGHELGLPWLGAPDDYTPSPSSNLVLKSARSQLIEIEGKNHAIAYGRIMCMWGFDRNEAQHFAIVGRGGGGVPSMIHALSKRGKVVEHAIDKFWLRRLVTVFEYPDTEPLAV